VVATSAHPHRVKRHVVFEEFFVASSSHRESGNQDENNETYEAGDTKNDARKDFILEEGGGVRWTRTRTGND